MALVTLGSFLCRQVPLAIASAVAELQETMPVEMQAIEYVLGSKSQVRPMPKPC